MSILAIIQITKPSVYPPIKLSSARDADPGALQKEKKSVFVEDILAFQSVIYLTLTLRLPYAHPSKYHYTADLTDFFVF